MRTRFGKVLHRMERITELDFEDAFDFQVMKGTEFPDDQDCYEETTAKPQQWNYGECSEIAQAWGKMWLEITSALPTNSDFSCRNVCIDGNSSLDEELESESDEARLQVLWIAPRRKRASSK